MISYLNGLLEGVEEGVAIVDVGGMGFNVFVSGSTIDRLPSVGEPIKLYTYMNVKEDDISLFGFMNRDELRLFKLLITVSGIGPKGALSLLSVMTPDDLRFAIVSGDSGAISKAPGIGKKTAERITVDLRDKISNEELTSGISVSDIAGQNDETGNSRNDAVEALVSLGYGQQESMRAVRKVLADKSLEGSDTEVILKLALKEMF